jgi:hypothetical protein
MFISLSFCCGDRGLIVAHAPFVSVPVAPGHDSIMPAGDASHIHQLSDFARVAASVI